MVFVHGGGFGEGSGTYPLYSGGNLATAAGVIVVTIRVFRKVNSPVVVRS